MKLRLLKQSLEDRPYESANSGLRTGRRKVKDRQAPVGQGYAMCGITPDAARIRAAMPDRLRHLARTAGQFTGIELLLDRENRDDAAHSARSSAPGRYWAHRAAFKTAAHGKRLDDLQAPENITRRTHLGGVQHRLDIHHATAGLELSGQPIERELPVLLVRHRQNHRISLR